MAVAGIGFAVLLMFTQVGFQNALFDSQVKMIDDLQGDIFLVSRAKYTLAAEKRFPAGAGQPGRLVPRRGGRLSALHRTDAVAAEEPRARRVAARRIRSARSASGWTIPIFKSAEINSQLDAAATAEGRADRRAQQTRELRLSHATTPTALRAGAGRTHRQARSRSSARSTWAPTSPTTAIW